jgi:prolipoprotein diacylglyceryltransferase
VFPALIQFGPFRFPTYATLLSLGLTGGVVVSVWQGRRRGLALPYPFDAALLGASGGLVGARATYVAVNWAYYHDHLSEALRLWAGGLAWQGGLALGLLLVALYAARFRLPLGALLDTLALGLAWFTLSLWLGSGAAADVYGRETFPTDGLLWTLSADLPDLYGLHAPRVNVPLLGAAWSGLVLIGLWLLTSPLVPIGRRPGGAGGSSGLSRRRSGAPGTLFLAWLGLTGLGGLALVPLQANAVPYLFRLRLDWLFNLALTVGGLGGLVVLRFWTKDGRPAAVG